MSEKTLFVTKIEQLLRTNTAMSLSQLCQALNNRSRRSVYRDLKKVSLVTSFSHAGQYHALKSAAKFDLHDL
jgi:predicted DNA-binding transcriptional regulator YafY